MKHYRAHPTRHTIQKRVFLFFWKTLWEYGYYNTYNQANKKAKALDALYKKWHRLW